MGVAIALTVTAAWAVHLAYALLAVDVTGMVSGGAAPFAVLLVPVHVVAQAYFSTGLFITAHDAMHGSAARNRRLNRFIGAAAAFLFAGFSYRRLITNHMKHHRRPAAEGDPDFFTGSQNFFVWFAVFFSRYATVTQIVIMAVIFNVLIRVAPVANVVLFWMVPAFLGTFQLFSFGTYLPHRLPHTPDMLPHNARSQRRNHLLALLSCYFFGYHSEHHASPRTPWWRLPAAKDAA